MSDDGRGHKRATDDIILEMHGMLKTFIERLDNHIATDSAHHMEEKHALIGFDARLVPVEQFRERCTFAGKIVAGVVVAVPTITAAAVGIWEFLKRARTWVNP